MPVGTPRRREVMAMIIPASGSGFNSLLAEALEREKKERKKAEEEGMTERVRLVGQYLADHAEELYAVAYDDLTADDIQIHIKRRGKEPCTKETVELGAETANSLRHAAGRSISYLQNVYEILDAELQGTDFEEDSDKIFREWRKDRVT